jgi:hypothetical protein
VIGRKGSAPSTKGKRGRPRKVVVEEVEDDEGPEEVTMASQRAAAEEQRAREDAAAQRIEQMKQSKAEKEAAVQARREQQRAAKLRRQQEAGKGEGEEQQQQQSAPEGSLSQAQSSDFLPDDLLNAIGQNVTSPRVPHHREPSARAVKKEAVERRLSKIWEETGIVVAVAKKPVEVHLPKEMVEFLAECQDKIARAPVGEKRKRQKRTPNKTSVM